MHLKSKTYPIRAMQQYGATLVLSLMLLAILTILSTTMMQSSYLSFKSQSSRVAFQQSSHELNQFQLQAAKQIKSFIDSRRDSHVELKKSYSEGFKLIDDLLNLEVIAEEDNAQLRHILSYSSSQMEIDVYITQSRLRPEYSGNNLLQYDSYSQHIVQRSADQRYLYLQLHCISKPGIGQNQGPVHLVGDFRFEVS